METTVTISLSEYKGYEKLDEQLRAKEALCAKLKYELESKNTFTVKIDVKKYGYHSGEAYVPLDEYKFDVVDHINTDETVAFRKWLLVKEESLHKITDVIRDTSSKANAVYNKLNALPSFVKWLFKIKL